jgi:ATP dependent DNA ligase domain
VRKSEFLGEFQNLIDRLVRVFVALPLFNGSLIRRDKCIPAFHKFGKLFWDLIASHAWRIIAESPDKNGLNVLIRIGTRRHVPLPAPVRLITRNANDFTHPFPFIEMAIKSLPVRSCLIDGEAIVRDENGLAVFDLIRRHGALATAVLCAFDLLELDGQDLRREPIEERKRLLSKLLKGQQASIVLNEHYEEDGAIVFREACKLGCKGIVSKRLGSAYRSRRSPHWVKVKNPNAPAVKREAEEDWGY